MDPHISPVESWLTRNCFRAREKTERTARCWLLGSSFPRREDKLIFRNVSRAELDRNEAFDISNSYKDNCSTCRGIINRIQKLIKEIDDIKTMETYAICDHCLLGGGKCERCRYILGKLTIYQRSLLEERYQRFKSWLNNANVLINAIMNGEQVCRGDLHRQTFDAAEFENLLRELKTPMTPRRIREPCRWAGKFTRCKMMLREIIIILKSNEEYKRWSPKGSISELLNKLDILERGFESEVNESSEEGRNIEIKVNEPLDKQAKECVKSKSVDVSKKSEVTNKTIPELQFNKGLYLKGQEQAQEKGKLRYPAIGISHDNKTIQIPPIFTKRLTRKTPTSKVNTNQSLGVITETASEENKSKSSTKLSIGVINDTQLAIKEKESKLSLNIRKGEKNDTPLAVEENKRKVKTNIIQGETYETQLASADNLSESRINDTQTASGESDSKLSSNISQGVINEINDTQLAGEEKRTRSSSDLSKRAKNVTKSVSTENQIISEYERLNSEKPLIHKLIPKMRYKKSFSGLSAHTVKPGRFVNIDGVMMQIPEKGSIFYKLSDKKFIKMGWTQLPTAKVMRRMKVYKMEPTGPNLFDQMENGTTLSYGTGEKFAELKNDRGQLYYQNGTVALDYYHDSTEGAQKQLSLKRYVIYSHEEDPDKPQSVLACFDDLCNGVVYDVNGVERLKYNQSEGKLIDPKLGSPAGWKWHSLNEPPVLHHALIETYETEPCPDLEELMEKHGRENKNEDPVVKKDSTEFLEDPMISMELINMEKWAGAAEKQKYEPIKIKIKTVKINEYFALRLVEQTNINVTFKDGDKHLKLNLGMMLISNTIIGLNMVDPYDVVTPYIRSAPSGLSGKNQNKMREKLEAVRAQNEDVFQFELKRDSYNLMDADASKIFASSFKLIHLQ